MNETETDRLFDDPANFTIKPEDIKAAKKRGRPKDIKVPYFPKVPLNVVAMATHISKTAAFVFMLAYREMIMQNLEVVTIDPDLLRMFHISQSAYADAINALEAHGMITTERPKNRRIQIRLNPQWWTPENSEQMETVLLRRAMTDRSLTSRSADASC